VNTNNNRIAIDKFGAYFSDAALDTINYCEVPLTYLNPQVENQNGIITDTLNWTPVQGTFVANGTEKYMVIGNFRTNAATNTLLINSPLAFMSADIYVDDVSLIELDLPAYAGPDVNFIPGNIFYIGRPPDVGINEACTWFALPDMTNTLAISAGLWVSPANTTTYVVRQEICGVVKWDTVVAHKSAVGLEELKIKSEQFKVFPNPAKDELSVSFDMEGLDKEFTKAEILNNLGQLVKEIDLNFTDKKVGIALSELPSGVYLLNLKGVNSQTISKRFVVSD
jgi:hypothetical protein